MINYATTIHQLDILQLYELYKEDIERDRVLHYSYLEPSEGKLCAENDLYIYLRDVFFRQSRGVFCILSDTDRYISAVRIEKYRDGNLLNALITDEKYRRKGYASALLNVALADITGPVYSHIHRKNRASICVHNKFGFIKCLDYAVLLDGSVCTDHFTYIRH